MNLNINNPWLVGIIGGALGAIVAGIVLYYLFEHRKQKILRSILMTSKDNADRLLEKNMTGEALEIYNKVLQSISEKGDQKFYGNIKNSKGECYLNLATIKDKEHNLIKAILVYKQALKIFNVDKYYMSTDLKIKTEKKYPFEYAMTQNNLGIAYGRLGEV